MIGPMVAAEQIAEKAQNGENISADLDRSHPAVRDYLGLDDSHA